MAGIQLGDVPAWLGLLVMAAGVIATIVINGRARDRRDRDHVDDHDDHDGEHHGAA